MEGLFSLRTIASSLAVTAERAREDGLDWQAELFEDYARELRAEDDLPNSPVLQGCLRLVSMLDEVYSLDPQVAVEFERGLERPVLDLCSKAESMLQDVKEEVLSETHA